jgi:hypothetical protein
MNGALISVTFSLIIAILIAVLLKVRETIVQLFVCISVTNILHGVYDVHSYNFKNN